MASERSLWVLYSSKLDRTGLLMDYWYACSYKDRSQTNTASLQYSRHMQAPAVLTTLAVAMMFERTSSSSDCNSTRRGPYDMLLEYKHSINLVLNKQTAIRSCRKHNIVLNTSMRPTECHRLSGDWHPAEAFLDTSGTFFCKFNTRVLECF
jgi:hypothetical protein